MPLPTCDISRLVVRRRRVRVQALGDVCEQREGAAGCWVCEGGGGGLGKGRGAGGVGLRHFEGDGWVRGRCGGDAVVVLVGDSRKGGLGDWERRTIWL